jgi:hypothetical protein
LQPIPVSVTSALSTIAEDPSSSSDDSNLNKLGISWKVKENTSGSSGVEPGIASVFTHEEDNKGGDDNQNIGTEHELHVGKGGDDDDKIDDELVLAEAHDSDGELVARIDDSDDSSFEEEDGSVSNGWSTPSLHDGEILDSLGFVDASALVGNET